MQDPRAKNSLPEARDIGAFAAGYFKLLFESSAKIDMTNLQKAMHLLEQTIKAEHVVYVAGNGGSAAIADHLCCDWTKGTFHQSFKTLKTFSLASNVPILTALANDLSYEEVFAKQLEFYCKAGDAVLLISSSGNSPNIVKAAAAAKKIGAPVIGLTGFEGGQLKKSCDISLHVPFNNYGIVEDCHQSLMHILAQYIARGRDFQK